MTPAHKTPSHARDHRRRLVEDPGSSDDKDTEVADGILRARVGRKHSRGGGGKARQGDDRDPE